MDQDQSNQILLISRFLLDFKREFNYPHVYRVWETIWAAGHVASPQFGLFIALSLVETYRDIIIDRWEQKGREFLSIFFTKYINLFSCFFFSTRLLSIFFISKHYNLVSLFLLLRNMDFTDIIKFFNEMAERHDEEEILETARDMVTRMKRISAQDE